MGTVSSALISALKLNAWGEDERGVCGGIFASSPPKWVRAVGLRAHSAPRGAREAKLHQLGC